MQRSAILGAEEVIGARLRRSKPYRRVSSGDHLALYAKSRDREAVEHILRNHRKLHWPSCRDVQRVDLVLAAWMLRFPHPLFADDVNVHRVCGRIVDAEVKQRAPD